MTRPLPSRRCARVARVGDDPVAGEQGGEQLEGLQGRAPPSRAGGRTGTRRRPLAMLNARCGPGAPHRAQSWKLGAQPATASERSR